MVFCYNCGKKKDVYNHIFCGYCATKFVVTETITVQSKPKYECICGGDCDLWCDPQCKNCYPPKS